MKRILSLVVAALLIISVLAAIPFAAPAAGNAYPYTNISFDEGFTDPEDYHYSEMTTDDAEHGAVIKYNAVAKRSSSSNNDSKWINAFRISNDKGDAAFEIEPGAKYQLTYDIKKVTAKAAFNVVLLQSKPDANIGQTHINEYFSWTDAVNYVILENYEDGETGGAWQTQSVTFTTNGNDTTRTNLILSLMASSKSTGNEILFDNIMIKKLDEEVDYSVEVKYHNTEPTVAESGETVVSTLGDIYNDFFFDGYYLEGWYLDSALTKKAPKYVSTDSLEVYGKWEIDNRIPQSTLMTYDEEGYVFTESGEGVNLSINGGEERFIVNHSGVAETVKEDGITPTKALHFTTALKTYYRWPSLATIYDTANDETAFIPKIGGAYRLKLKYRVDTKPTRKLFLQLMKADGIGNPHYGSWSANKIILDNIATIEDVTDGWKTAEAVFYTSDTTAINLSLVSAIDYADAADVDVYVDDIEITEILAVSTVSFEVNGGSAVSPITCIIGDDLPALPTPTRDGYVFAGWCSDMALKKQFAEAEMPARSLKLYAKWEAVATEPYTFNSGFEENEYDSGVTPYLNNNTDASTDVSGGSNNKDVRWLTNDSGEANSGEGRLYFDNITGEHIQSAKSYLAAGLVNPDGSFYQVVKGQRYHLRFALRFNGNSDICETIIFGTASPVANGGINAGNIKSVYTLDYSGNNGHRITNYAWYEEEVYFVAEETEKLFITVYSPYEYQWVEIDDVLVEPVDESVATTVEYYGKDGNLLSTRIGEVGSFLTDNDAPTVEGFVFVGWYDEADKIHISNKYPESDLKLYAKYEEGEIPALTPEFKDEYKTDFEDIEAAKAFYSGANANCKTVGPDGGMMVVGDDSEGAYEGSAYFRYIGVGQWTRAYYRCLRFFTPETTDNLIWLEPNSTYRVTYQIKVDSLKGGNLYLVGFNDEYKNSGIATEAYGYTIFAENYMTESALVADMGKYVQYETTIVTGDLETSLGLVLYGGYLTASIDDIQVTKLKTISIKFVDTDGSELNSVEQLSWNTVMQPMEPEKEGYVFLGWYADKELTKEFDFINTLIPENTTLYAKWEVRKPDIPIYENKTTYEDVEEIEQVIPDDAYLDEPLEYNTTDKILKVLSETEDGTFPWIWVIVAAAAVLVIGGGALAAILIAKRKKS